MACSSVSSSGGVDLVEGICREEEIQLLVITLKQGSASQSKAELRTSFHADINDKGLLGFYKSMYNTKGEEKAAVSTQFEAASARKAFPCPRSRLHSTLAPFMTRNWLLNSNGAPKSVHADVKTGRHPTKFKRTPRMSTYLGDFEHIEQVVGDGRQRIRA